MSDFDQDQFENELRSLRPAKVPKKVAAQLAAELSQAPAATSSVSSSATHGSFYHLLRWLIPTAVAGAAIVMIWIFSHSSIEQKPALPQSIAAAPTVPLKADKVEIDQQLVADFDAVAHLPSGEPVRFHCQQWLDKVRLRDSAAGLVVERKTPRLEIVPVRFESD